MKRFKVYREECDISKLRAHPKWDRDRYEKMKLGGMRHTQIEKVWDDEEESEKIATQMKKNNAIGKK